MKTRLRFFGLLIAAVLLGPVVFAVPMAIFSHSQNPRQPSDSLRLLRTFDDSFPQEVPMLSFDIDYFFRNCGYDRVDLMGNLSSMRERNGWIPYEGYYDLKRSISLEFLQKVEEERAKYLDQQLSSFELRFLNRCIANSAFSMACGFRVYKVLEKGDLYSDSSLPSSMPHFAQTGRMKTMCAFLDGVAARKGLKLGTVPPGSD